MTKERYVFRLVTIALVSGLAIAAYVHGIYWAGGLPGMRAYMAGKGLMSLEANMIDFAPLILIGVCGGAWVVGWLTYAIIEQTFMSMSNKWHSLSSTKDRIVFVGACSGVGIAVIAAWLIIKVTLIIIVGGSMVLFHKWHSLPSAQEYKTTLATARQDETNRAIAKLERELSIGIDGAIAYLDCALGLNHQVLNIQEPQCNPSLAMSTGSCW